MSLLVVELLLLFNYVFFSFHMFATNCLYANHSEITVKTFFFAWCREVSDLSVRR